MKLRIETPPASAKRLEKDRRFVIIGSNIFGDERKEVLIPEGEKFIEYEHTDESIDDYEILDGDIHYRFFIEYRNSTGTRIEVSEIDIFRRQI